MIEPWLRAILVCPACKGPLVDAPGALRCERCQKSYPVTDGIPDLVP